MATTWWIGGYGPDMDGTAEGISAARTREDGSLELIGLVAQAPSPSFLLAEGARVYAAAEGRGTVDSFLRDGHELTIEGSAPSGGTWPCQLSSNGSAVFVANYFDGPLGVVVGNELVQTFASEGSGPDERQEGPHAHSSIVLDDGATLLSLDLGTDEILIHAVREDRLERTGALKLAPGTGPRDVARHPSGPLTVLGELSGELLVLEWAGGQLSVVSSVALPGAEPGDFGAAIGFGAGGRFAYIGLRGSHRIAVLRTSDDGRTFEAVGSVSSEGEWPRHLAVDGDLLHVANQLSDSIASFRLGIDGMPVLIGRMSVPSPTYLLAVT